MPDGLRLVARGADLHVFAETTWYRLHLADLP